MIADVSYTEPRPASITHAMPLNGVVDVDVTISRWRRPCEEGLYMACIDSTSAVIMVVLMMCEHLLRDAFCTTEFILVDKNKQEDHQPSAMTVRASHARKRTTRKKMVSWASWFITY